MTNPVPAPAPIKLKTLTFGRIHPLVRHPTPEQHAAHGDDGRPTLIEAGGTTAFRVRPFQFFQPNAIHLVVPSGDEGRLEVVDVSYADPTAPEGECYVT